MSFLDHAYGLPVGPPDPGRLRRGEVVDVPPEVVEGGHAGGRQLWNSSENNLRKETKSIFAFFEYLCGKFRVVVLKAAESGDIFMHTCYVSGIKAK